MRKKKPNRRNPVPRKYFPHGDRSYPEIPERKMTEKEKEYWRKVEEWWEDVLEEEKREEWRKEEGY